MKKLLTMAIAAAMLIGCAEDGEDGAQGPQGPGATSHEESHLFSNSEFLYTYFPEENLDNNAVMVYMQNDFGEWSPLPYLDEDFANGHRHFKFEYDDFVTVYADGEDGFLYDYSESVWRNMRFVFIPFSAMQGDIDLNNFEAVEAAYLKN